MTEQETWEAALVKCGYWNKQEIEQVTCYDCSQPHTYPVYKTAPALGDAAAVVAMLEWLVNERWHIEIGTSHDPASPYFYVVGFPQGGSTIPLALAAAVNEV